MTDQPEQLKLLLSDGASNEAKKQRKAAAAANSKLNEPPHAQTSAEPTELSAPDSQASPTLPTNGATNMPEPTTKTDFESMLAELEKVVAQLEGELKLEQALALFERGLGLSQECEKFLKAAEQRIEILKRSSNGEMTVEAFAEEAEVFN